MEYLDKQKQRIYNSGARPTNTTQCLGCSGSDKGDGESGSDSAPGTDTTAANGDGGGQPFDPDAWGSGIGSVLGGVGDLIGGIKGGGSNQTAPTYQGGFNNNNTSTDDEKGNATLWIVLGIFGLILVIMIFMMMRKASAAPAAK